MRGEGSWELGIRDWEFGWEEVAERRIFSPQRMEDAETGAENSFITHYSQLTIHMLSTAIHSPFTPVFSPTTLNLVKHSETRTFG
jgi:hypothetical protein